MSLPTGGECTVGVDVGTTAVKAVAVDPAGHVVARARVPHRVGAASADSLEHEVAVAPSTPGTPVRAWVATAWQFQ